MEKADKRGTASPPVPLAFKFSITPQRLLLLLQGLLILQVIRGAVLADASDDPYYITAGAFVARGLKPFLDFPYSQGPLLPYLYAPAAWLLGPSILASRIFGALCTLALYAASLWSARRLFLLELPDRDPEPALPIALTALFFIHPELLAGLSRLDSRGALSALCCLLAVVSLSAMRRPKNLIVSALFCAACIGIKYPAGVICVPLFLFLFFAVSIKDALLFGFLAALFTSLLFLPFAVHPGGLDYLWQNYRAVQLLDQETPGFLAHLRQTAWPAIHQTARVAFKYQWAVVPAIGGMIWDLRQEGFRRVLAKGSAWLMATSLLCGTAMFLLIDPIVFRIWVYLPLLLVYASLALTRFWLALDDGSFSLTMFCRRHAGLCLALVGGLFLLNNEVLFPFTPHDTGLIEGNTWKLALRGIQPRVPRALVERWARPGEEVLYVGNYDNELISPRFLLSPLSGIGYLWRLGTHYDLAAAEHYHFLTEELLVNMLESGRFRLVVLADGLLDAEGLDSGRLRQALFGRYESVDHGGVITVYKLRPGPPSP